MLDLKAKLAAAGVVTEDQVRKHEAEQAKRRQSKNTRGRPGAPPKRGPVNVEELGKINKGEAYVRIRRLVQQHRLDAAESVVPSAEAITFGFVDSAGRLRQLLLEPDVHAKLVRGHAAISAYMSNNGLAHCVLAPAVALDLAKLFPMWLRTLTGNPDAGKVERPESSAAARVEPNADNADAGKVERPESSAAARVEPNADKAGAGKGERPESSAAARVEPDAEDGDASDET